VGLNHRPLRWEEQGILTLDLAKQSGLKDRRHKTKNRQWRTHRLGPSRTRTGPGGHQGRNKRTHKYRHYRTQRQAQEDTQTLNIGRKDRNKSTHGQEQEDTQIQAQQDTKTGTRGHTQTRNMGRKDRHKSTHGQDQEDLRTGTTGQINRHKNTRTVREDIRLCTTGCKYSIMMTIGQALEKTNRNITQGDSKSHERILQEQAQEDTRTGTKRLKDRHKRTQGQAQENTRQL
jgi:hypothetical protein